MTKIPPDQLDKELKKEKEEFGDFDDFEDLEKFKEVDDMEVDAFGNEITPGENLADEVEKDEESIENGSDQDEEPMSLEDLAEEEEALDDEDL